MPDTRGTGRSGSNVLGKLRDIIRRRDYFIHVIRPGLGRRGTDELNVNSPMDFRGNNILHEGRATIQNETVFLNENPPGAIVVRDIETVKREIPCVTSYRYHLMWRSPYDDVNDNGPHARLVLDRENYTSIIQPWWTKEGNAWVTNKGVQWLVGGC